MLFPWFGYLIWRYAVDSYFQSGRLDYRFITLPIIVNPWGSVALLNLEYYVWKSRALWFDNMEMKSLYCSGLVKLFYISSLPVLSSSARFSNPVQIKSSVKDNAAAAWIERLPRYGRAFFVRRRGVGAIARNAAQIIKKNWARPLLKWLNEFRILRL